MRSHPGMGASGDRVGEPLSHGRNKGTRWLLVAGAVLIAGGFMAECRAAGTWSAAGSLATARDAHSATLLQNGKVLVAGGLDGGGYLASAELYDPGANTSSPAGNLTTARESHRATLLPSGKVLVAGGNGLASAELYHPGTNTWSAAGSLATARRFHTATLLPSGKVLVAGGEYGDGSALASAEQYDPGTNTWSVAAGLASARLWHTATLLPSGKVLVAGGGGSSNVTVASAETYDPGTNTWSAAASLATDRFAHTATLLPSGNVLVVGGWSSSNGGLASASAELYDYTGGGSWSAAGSLATGRSGHTATLLPSGKLLVAGGANGSSYLASAEQYDPGTNTWSAAGSLTTARWVHTATLLPSGKVLVAGGGGVGPKGNSNLASAELYDPGSNTWSAAGSLANARAGHTATLLPNGKVLVAGGGGSGGSLVSAKLYDPGTNTWSAAGGLATERCAHTATLLPSGKVLLVGGQDNSGVLASAELYDPGTDTWSLMASLGTARSQHTATLLLSGKVLVAAGHNDTLGWLASAELYDPGSNTWSAAGSLTAARYGHTAALLPSGRVLIAGGFSNGPALASAELYDPGTNAWSAAGSLATGRGSHTATLLPNGFVLIAGGWAPSLASAELYGGGLGFLDSWRPVISSATSPLALSTRLVLGGSGFKGLSEASGGGFQSSATNYPLVQLRSLVNDQTAFLLSDPFSNWSNTSFTSVPVLTFPQGYAQVTVFTNGIPSASQTIIINPPTFTKLQILAPGEAAAPGTPSGKTGTPTAQTSGAPLNVTVNAVGDDWYRVSTVTDTVSITSSDTKATLPENAALVNGTQTFGLTLKTAGTATVTASDITDGTKTSNTSPAITVNARPITVTAATDTKTYDGTASSAGVPTITSGSLAAGDSATWTQTFNNKNVGTGKTLTPSGTVSDGNSGNNYSVTCASVTTGAITVKTLTVSGITAQDKVYDGTTTATLTGTPGTMVGAVAGDTVSLTGTAGGAFAGRHVGTGKTVTVSGQSLTGTDARNYALTEPTTTANITARAITVTAANDSKTYDGTTNSAGVPAITVGSLASGDTASWTQTFGNKNVGTGKTLTPTGTVSDGNSGNNYSVTFVSNTTGIIRPTGTVAALTFSPVQGVYIGAQSVAVSCGTSGATIYYTTDGSTPTAASSQYSVPINVSTTMTIKVYAVKEGLTDSAAASATYSVYLPNSGGSGAPTPNTGATATNPVDGTSVTVAMTDGGVVVLQVGQNGGALPAGYTATTIYYDASGNLVGTVQGTEPGYIFTEPGMYVAVVTLTDAQGNFAGETEIALPISPAETGAAQGTTPPSNPAIAVASLKGKLLFRAGKADTVTFKGVIELPAGLDLSQPQTLSLSLGNVVDTASLNTKGQAKTGARNRLKNLAVKYPRLKKPATTTSAGQNATVSFTLSAPQLDVLGFDCAGVSKKGGIAGQSVPRTIGAALLLGGTAYRVDVPVTWKLSKKGDNGQVASKR